MPVWAILIRLFPDTFLQFFNQGIEDVAGVGNNYNLLESRKHNLPDFCKRLSVFKINNN